jgi:hypothetical protein
MIGYLDNPDVFAGTSRGITNRLALPARNYLSGTLSNVLKRAMALIHVCVSQSKRQ